jgi:hypothetical protein
VLADFIGAQLAPEKPYMEEVKIERKGRAPNGALKACQAPSNHILKSVRPQNDYPRVDARRFVVHLFKSEQS